MTNPELKVIEGGNPYFHDVLRDFLKRSEQGKLRGMCIVVIEDELVYTDWVKNVGTSMCELSGAVNILQQELIERMRDAVK